MVTSISHEGLAKYHTTVDVDAVSGWYITSTSPSSSSIAHSNPGSTPKTAVHRTAPMSLEVSLEQQSVSTDY
jgi:hypothetical protein